MNIEYLCIFSAAGEGTPPDTRFIEDGVTELLKTRRVLKCSYPYGFFLQQGSTQKEIFELMQVIGLISKTGNLPEILEHGFLTASRLSPSDRPGDGGGGSGSEGQPALPQDAAAQNNQCSAPGAAEEAGVPGVCGPRCRPKRLS